MGFCYWLKSTHAAERPTGPLHSYITFIYNIRFLKHCLDSKKGKCPFQIWISFFVKTAKTGSEFLQSKSELFSILPPEIEISTRPEIFRIFRVWNDSTSQMSPVGSESKRSVFPFSAKNAKAAFDETSFRIFPQLSSIAEMRRNWSRWKISFLCPIWPRLRPVVKIESWVARAEWNFPVAARIKFGELFRRPEFLNRRAHYNLYSITYKAHEYFG